MYNSRDVNSSAKRSPISFSSTLLDEIYRSIDDGSERSPREKERVRAEKRIEKKKTGGGLSLSSLSPPLTADVQKVQYSLDIMDNNDALFFSSGSNSSDSNSSLFSDHDSIPLPTSKTRSSCFLPPKPKPIRTKTTLAKTEQDDENDVVPKSTSTTKSRALKMYAHLKKMKQPISPGMKLTTFINSILHNTKSKSKRGPTSDDRSKKPTTKCSSATSFLRSQNLYLNQQTTPSCNSVKMEAERPAQTFTLNRDEKMKSNSSKFHIAKPVDDDDDDEGSSSSSASSDCSEDLFEIDHLKLRFGELPVYETTTSKTSTTRLSSTANQSRTFIKGKR